MPRATWGSEASEGVPSKVRVALLTWLRASVPNRDSAGEELFVCVCERAHVCACVRARVCVCVTGDGHALWAHALVHCPGIILFQISSHR